MIDKLKVLFWLVLCAPMLPRAQAGELDSSWRFRVLQSPHFEIIFREDHKELAKRYILAAEQAHELLFPIFKEGPSHTIIFLRDDTDWLS